MRFFLLTWITLSLLSPHGIAEKTQQLSDCIDREENPVETPNGEDVICIPGTNRGRRQGAAGGPSNGNTPPGRNNDTAPPLDPDNSFSEPGVVLPTDTPRAKNPPSKPPANPLLGPEQAKLAFELGLELALQLARNADHRERRRNSPGLGSYEMRNINAALLRSEVLYYEDNHGICKDKNTLTGTIGEDRIIVCGRSAARGNRSVVTSILFGAVDLSHLDPQLSDKKIYEIVDRVIREGGCDKACWDSM